MSRPVAMLTVPLLLIPAPVGGCAQSEQPRSNTDAVETTYEFLQARHEAVDSIRYTRTLAEQLPNQRISIDGGEPVATSSGVVVGQVLDAQVVGAHRIASGDDGEELPAGSAIPLSADDADWYDVELNVAVSEAWSEEAAEGEEIRLSVSYAGADLETFVQGLRSLGTIVAVLGEPRAGGAVRVLWDGSTLGQVSDTGELRFPAMSEIAAREFLAGIRTTAHIAEAASAARADIVVRDFQRID